MNTSLSFTRKKTKNCKLKLFYIIKYLTTQICSRIKTKLKTRLQATTDSLHIRLTKFFKEFISARFLSLIAKLLRSDVGCNFNFLELGKQ